MGRDKLDQVIVFRSFRVISRDFWILRSEFLEYEHFPGNSCEAKKIYSASNAESEHCDLQNSI